MYQWLALRFGHNYIAHILHAYKVTANILYLFQIIISSIFFPIVAQLDRCTITMFKDCVEQCPV